LALKQTNTYILAYDKRRKTCIKNLYFKVTFSLNRRNKMFALSPISYILQENGFWAGGVVHVVSMQLASAKPWAQSPALPPQ
jgi:hypothetical protein